MRLPYTEELQTAAKVSIVLYSKGVVCGDEGANVDEHAILLTLISWEDT